MFRSILYGLGALAGVAGIACQPDSGLLPTLDKLRQPTGLAMSTDRQALFVSNGNWDRAEVDSTLMVVDLPTLYAELAQPAEPGQRDRPCRRVSATDATIECVPAEFIDARRTVRLATGAGPIAVDRRTDQQGPSRLLVPTRRPATVTWLDVVTVDGRVALDCDQDDEGRCGEAHEIRSAARSSERLPGEPVRVTVDDQGARFAYVPHLLGGSLSLLALDGSRGPELIDVEGDFFREDPFEEDELQGGFDVAARACDPLRPSVESRDCERPFLYASQRYFPGLREFVVAPGLDLIGPGREVSIVGINPQVVSGRPFMGGVAFEDPQVGDRLLVVQTTPPGLIRLDTSLGDDDRPVDTIVDVLPLCERPNLITVHRPTEGEALALIPCAGDGRLAVVGLASFRVLAFVPVGLGAYEVVVDPVGRQAFVSNPVEHTISIVSLDPRDPQRLTEWARLGVGAGTRTLD